MGLKKISRRKFIGQASCAALGSTTVLSTLANLLAINSLAETNTSATGYKALVCVLLHGGNDSFNMLVPRGTNEYAEYAQTRSDLALPQADLLPLTPNTSIGKELGLHPSMGGLQTMFNNGNAALVANVGTLVEPISSWTEYNSGLKKTPLGLFSHSDQQQQWQTAVPQSREAIGWGGKLADMLKSLNANQSISMNISLGGRNVFQSGTTVSEYSISNTGNGVEGIEPISVWYSDSGFLNNLRETAMKDMATEMYANVFKQTFGELTSQALDNLAVFQNAIAAVPPFTTTFTDHHLAHDLRMVAKVIAANADLNVSRQTFFVEFHGWDHHNEVLNNQLYMLGIVSNAISEFFSALTEVGLQDNVTLFTISDFARTLTSNGKGSDHAWGGNAIVAGGAVKGKEIYGTYPDLYLSGNPLVTSSRGHVIPTTAADLYFAEMALWFGVAPSDLSLIFPNITNFYSPGSGTPPLGFLL